MNANLILSPLIGAHLPYISYNKIVHVIHWRIAIERIMIGAQGQSPNGRWACPSEETIKPRARAFLGRDVVRLKETGQREVMLGFVRKIVDQCVLMER